MQGELKLDDFPAVWENEPTSLSKLSVRGIGRHKENKRILPRRKTSDK